MSVPNVRRGSWIVILPVAAVAVAYVVWVFMPGQRAIAELREKIKAKQDFIAEGEQRGRTLKQCKQILEKTHAYVTPCRKRIPEEKELGAIFGEIHELANGAGIHITRFDPQAPLALDTLRRIPINLGCTGSFGQVYEFLRKLEGMPTASWVVSVKIERSAKNEEDVQGEVALVIFCANSESSGYAMYSN